MVDSKENYTFEVGVKGLKHFILPNYELTGKIFIIDENRKMFPHHMPENFSLAPMI